MSPTTSSPGSPDDAPDLPPTSGLSDSQRALIEAVARRLVGPKQKPNSVVAAWTTHGTAFLSAGRCWEEVQVPAWLGRKVLALGHTMGTGLESGSWPVFCTPEDDRISFLVPLGTAVDWAVPDTVCLFDGQVEVPAPTSDDACTDVDQGVNADTPCTQSAPHWIQPPFLNNDGKLLLTNPRLLAPALDHIVQERERTSHQVSAADRERSGGVR